MSSFYKNLGPNDVSSIRSVINETVPINGSLFWTAYPTYPDNPNIKKNIPTKMFVEAYDAPVSFSSANKIMDVTLMVHDESFIFTGLYNPSKDGYASFRKNAYKSLALHHLGVGTKGEIIRFDKDGDFFSTTTDIYNELFALSFSRLTYKDSIKKGSFKIVLALNPGGYDPATGNLPTTLYKWNGVDSTQCLLEITDYMAESNYKTNSLVGDFAILYAQQPTNVTNPILQGVSGGDRKAVGLIFYNTGTVFLSPQLFAAYNPVSGFGFLNNSNVEEFRMLYASDGSYDPGNPEAPSSYYDIYDLMCGYDADGSDINLTIMDFATALFPRIYSIEFQNTIELNSTVYFCRVNHNEFNYSSNPTYLSGSRIRVKSNSFDPPVSYITGIGLYDKAGELLAVAKLSEPIRKSTDVDLTLRVRLDF